MSSPLPEDNNEYVVLHAVTPVDRLSNNNPRYEYLGGLPTAPLEIPHYETIGMQKGDYSYGSSSYVEAYKPHEYLHLEDCTYANANEDIYNYYEDITYEKAEKKSSNIIRILIIVVTLLVILIAILTGVLSWNFYFSKSKLPGEAQFCTDLANQITCRQSFVKNMTRDAFQAYQSYAWGAPEFRPIALESFSNNFGHGEGLGIFPGLITIEYKKRFTKKLRLYIYFHQV